MVKDWIGKQQWNFLPKEFNLFNFEGIDAVPMFYLYLFLTWSAVWLIGMIWFCVKIKETQIQMRSPTLVILSSVGAELSLLCTTLDIFLTHARYPCFLDLWYILSFFPLYFIPFVLRFLRYFFTMKEFDRWQKGKIEDPRASKLVLESTWVIILGYFLTITMSCAVIFQWTFMKNSLTSYGCEITSITFWVLIVMFSLCLFVVACGLFFMRKIPDPYHLKSELVTCFTLWVLTLGPYIFLYNFMADQRNYITALMFFFIVGGYFTSVIWPIYLTYIAPPEQSTPEKILDTIEQIALDPEGYHLIEQIAADKHASETPPFIRDIIEFRQLTDSHAMKARAKEIYDTYIKAGAPKQNNLSQSMVRTIEAQLAEPTSDIFNQAYREVMKLLKTNFIRDVKNLPAYAELVKKREAEIEAQRIQAQVIIGH